MVVPVEPRAFQIVVERGRAEVVDLHGARIAVAAVRLERLARGAIHEECQVQAEALRTRHRSVDQRLRMTCDQHLRLAFQQHIAWQQAC